MSFESEINIQKLFFGICFSGISFLFPQDYKGAGASADNKERKQPDQHRHIGIVSRIRQLRRMGIDTLLGSCNRVRFDPVFRSISGRFHHR